MTNMIHVKCMPRGALSGTWLFIYLSPVKANDGLDLLRTNYTRRKIHNMQFITFNLRQSALHEPGEKTMRAEWTHMTGSYAKSERKNIC